MSEFAGTYNIEINTPMGKQEGTLTLSQEGDSLSGNMAAMGESVDIENGAVNGDTATWEVKVSKPMPLTLSFSGQMDGANLNGKVQLGAFGESQFTATAA